METQNTNMKKVWTALLVAGFVVAGSAQSVGAEAHERDDAALVVEPYFGKGFGSYFLTEAVLVWRAPDERHKSPPPAAWVLCRSDNDENRVRDTAIEMRGVPEDVAAQLAALDKETRYWVKVVGYETLEAGGQAGGGESFGIQPRADASWSVRNRFCVRRLTVVGPYVEPAQDVTADDGFDPFAFPGMSSKASEMLWRVWAQPEEPSEYFVIVPALTGRSRKFAVWQVPTMSEYVATVVSPTSSVHAVSQVLIERAKLAVYLDTTLLPEMADAEAHRRAIAGNDYFEYTWTETPVAPVTETRHGYAYMQMLSRYMTALEAVSGTNLCFDVAQLARVETPIAHQNSGATALMLRAMSPTLAAQCQTLFLEDRLNGAMRHFLPADNSFASVDDGWRLFATGANAVARYIFPDADAPEIEFIQSFPALNMFLFRGPKDATGFLVSVLSEG